MNSLFDLLFWPQLVGVSTLLLAAVGCTGVQPGIAPTGDETCVSGTLLSQCNG